MMKRVLGISVAGLVALGAGWVCGGSGRADRTRALRVAELRDGLLEGRAAVLDARLDIDSVNCGEASRRLEAARSIARCRGSAQQSRPPGGYTLYGKKLENSEIVTKGVRPPKAAAKLFELLNRYSAKARKH